MKRERDNTKTMGDRRREPRHAVKIDVNYRHDENYLYTHTHSGNISEMGIFLLSEEPLAVDTQIELRFAVPGEPEPLRVGGEVRWVVHSGTSAEPGMGVKFLDSTDETRKRIRELIRTMAYLE